MSPVAPQPSSPTRTIRKPPREPPPPYAEPNPTLIVDENTPLLLSTASSSPRARTRRSISNATATSSHPSPPISPVIRPRRTNSDDASVIPLLDTQPESLPLSERSRIYFSVLRDRRCWMAVVHLGLINFPFGLVAWLYLFVATLVGTTLLLTLPFGVLIWWANLRGARAFTRWELQLQAKFHNVTENVPLDPVPYLYQPRSTLNRHQESLHSPLIRPSNLESAVEASTAEPPPPVYEETFLQNTYAMFLDPSSYQPLFYFLVIKSTTALLITPLVLAFVPVSLILVVPAPLVLRLVKRVGRWQADLALEGLQWFVQY